MHLKTLVLSVICSLFVATLSAQPLSRRLDYNYNARHYNEFSDRKKKRLQRMYGGYGIPFMSVDMSVRYYAPEVPNGSNSPIPGYDGTKQFSVNPNKRFSVVGGAFFPLFDIDKESAIGFDICASGDVYSLQTATLNYGSAVSMQEDGASFVYILPTMLCYKNGGEVTLNKNNKALFTFGCGIAPSMALSKLFTSSAQFYVRRFAAVEFGLRTGIAWKMRLSYYSGNVNLVHATASDIYSVSSYTGTNTYGSIDVVAVGSGGFNFSVMAFPFSVKWSKDKY